MIWFLKRGNFKIIFIIFKWLNLEFLFYSNTYHSVYAKKKNFCVALGIYVTSLATNPLSIKWDIMCPYLKGICGQHIKIDRVGQALDEVMSHYKIASRMCLVSEFSFLITLLTRNTYQENCHSTACLFIYLLWQVEKRLSK